MDPDMRLVRFLTQLVVDDDLRGKFDADPTSTLDTFNPKLSDEVKTAILERKRQRVVKLLNIANQSSDPSAKKKAAKAAKAVKATKATKVTKAAKAAKAPK